MLGLEKKQTMGQYMLFGFSIHYQMRAKYSLLTKADEIQIQKMCMFIPKIK